MGTELNSSAPNRCARLLRGEHIFRSGDRAPYVYMVRKGAVKTYILSTDGEEQIISFLSPGDIAGIDTFGHTSQTRNAMALEDSEVCRLPLDNLVNACTRNPGLHSRIMDAVSREVHRLQSMLKMERMTAEQRIAMFLLNQARRQAGQGHDLPLVHLAMTRGDIGRFLDLAVETVSRNLTRLQSLGYILVDRNTIELLDSERLQQLARGRPAAGGAAVAA
jgi:CRP/FNR family transcriptional regulator